jgi:hypothetical protein
MSGLYASIYSNKDGTFTGWTHGCDCCAREEYLDKSSIQEHINSLKKDLENALKIQEQINNRPEYVECPACGGAGDVLVGYDMEAPYEGCKICKGTGELTSEQFKQWEKEREENDADPESD